jgi:hypothetical protein
MTQREKIIEMLEDYEQHRILIKDDFADEYGLAQIKTTTEQIVDDYLKTRK